MSLSLALLLEQFTVPASQKDAPVKGWPEANTEFSPGQAWASAYRNWFSTGTPAPIPFPLVLAELAFAGAMDTSLALGVGSKALTAGFVAFYGVVSTQAAVLWPALTAVSFTPPPLIVEVGSAILAAGTPFATTPLPNPWSQERARADTFVLATAVFSSSQGGIIVAGGPTLTPFVLV